MNIYETHLMKEPSLPFIFHRDLCIKENTLCQVNWHENVEIISFLSGEGVMVYDAMRLPVKAGQIAVINSNRLHSFGGGEELCYRCLIVDRGFCMSNYFDTNQICFDRLFEDAEISALIETLAEEYAISAEEPYRVPSIRSTVLQLMTLLCKRHTLAKEVLGADERAVFCVRKAIGYVRAEYRRDLSLDEVSEFVGLSKYYFAREFHRITGYTFVTYVNLTRCEAAKTLLREGKRSIGSVAAECGFSGFSYFTRTFRKYVGMFPSEYRADLSR